MADNGIQRAPTSRAQTQPEQQPQVTTTTVTGATASLPFFAVDCPKLGGQPLICQAENEAAGEAIYRKAVKGLDARAELTVVAATDAQIREFTENQSGK